MKCQAKERWQHHFGAPPYNLPVQVSSGPLGISLVVIPRAWLVVNTDTYRYPKKVLAPNANNFFRQKKISISKKKLVTNGNLEQFQFSVFWDS